MAAGILLSRIAGLLRDRTFAHYFGMESDAGDAFRAASRIPNILQNLFGEGVLSASFIPVYAQLVAREEKEEAGKVAGAIFSILALLTSVLVLLGILFTPSLIWAIAGGFKGEKRELTITLVRVLFPGVGILVLSAWCLGILNSHRRFFLSYSAPVLWNAAMIAGLLYFGSRSSQASLATKIAWVSVIGSAAQFLVQLPVVLRVAPALRFRIAAELVGVQTVLRNFVPVFFSRGVSQISAYIDSYIASFLPIGAVSALGYSQTISMLPVSLFGMAITAAELPAMSSATGSIEEIHALLRSRLTVGLQRITFLVIPSVVAFVALGDVLAGAIYESGNFKHADSVRLWVILAGSGIGLLASTQGRLYSSTFYALQDTRTPLRFAIVRVVLTTVLGYLAAFPLQLGVAGLTASAGVSGWVEFALLRRALGNRIGATQVGFAYLARLWAVAIFAATAAFALKGYVTHWHPILQAIAILGPYGAIYLGGADPTMLRRYLRLV